MKEGPLSPTRGMKEGSLPKEGNEGRPPLPNEGEGWGEGEIVNELVNTYWE